MKYGRNKIKDIFRDGISCLYLDEEQDDFCNFVEKLQQENEQLKADYGNIAQVERDILLQQKEELIKHCENEIFSQKESIELLSNKKYADIHIGAINAYKNILSKLKGE